MEDQRRAHSGSISYKTQHVVICSVTLPVSLTFTEETGEWKAEFDETLMFEQGYMYLEIRKELISIGWEVSFVGTTPCYVAQRGRFGAEEALRAINCHPVWLEKNQAQRFYQGYCKTVLWPIFHNVIDAYGKIVQVKESLRDTNTSTLSFDRFRRNNEESETGSNQNIISKWHPGKSYSVTGASLCWKEYVEVNLLFSKKLVEVCHNDDLVWVQDYHLLVLPSLVVRKLPEVSIGLHVHVPFPSSECFRILSHREEILKSMLCAQHIGFHLYEYSRHFLTCCKRMLGLKCEPQKGAVMEVQYNKRIIRVGCSHIGLKPRAVMQCLNKLKTDFLNESSNKSAVEFKQYCKSCYSVENKFVFLSLSEVESLAGIIVLLVAFQAFLRQYKNTELCPQKQCAFILIGLTPDSRPDNYSRTRKELIHLVNIINRKYGPNIVIFKEVEKIDLQERTRLYNAADTFVETPIRGRLSMTPFEYLVATQEDPGAIIVSEFATAFRMMAGAIKINPYRLIDFEEAYGSSMKMSNVEKKARNARDIAMVEHRTITEWCSRFLFDMREAIKANINIKPNQILHGFGLGVELTETKISDKRGLRLLNTSKLSEAYSNAKSRLLLFDYSGTLVETSSIDTYMKAGGMSRTWHYENGGSKRPAGCLETRDLLPQALKQKLRSLANDERNTVVIISSDLREELAHAVADIENLVLVAENGYVFRMKGSDEWETVVDESGSGVWYSNPASNSARSIASDTVVTSEANSSGHASTSAKLALVTAPNDPLLDSSWQEDVSKLMTHYTMTTNGTFCWLSPSAVSFNFVLADPEWGFISAESLFGELESYVAGMPLSVEKGKGFVTVRLAGVNRGAATAAILTKASGEDFNNEVEFIWCVGDDIEDEVNFLTTQKYRKNLGSSTSLKLFNTKVGWTQKSSRAKYYVDDCDALGATLRNLVRISEHPNGFNGSEEEQSFEHYRLDASASMSIAAKDFVTKESMLDLNMKQSSESSFKTQTTEELPVFSPRSSTAEGIKSYDSLQRKQYSTLTSNSSDQTLNQNDNLKSQQSAWGKQLDKYTDVWAMHSENESQKVSGLSVLKQRQVSNIEVKKNVSFKDLPSYNKEDNKASPPSFAVSRRGILKSSPDLRNILRREEAIDRSQSIHESPSYIATPEEQRALFGGFGGDLQQPPGRNDTRKIPPTRSTADLNLSHNIAANTNTTESESPVDQSVGVPQKRQAIPSNNNKIDSSAIIAVVALSVASYILGTLTGINIKR